MSEKLNQLVKLLNIPGELVAVDESLVYRVQVDSGLEAWKAYPNFPVSSIIRYQETTNRVAEIINGTEGLISASDEKLHFPFNWEVNLIHEVIEQNGVAVAKSRFIETNNTLKDLLGNVSDQEMSLHPLQQIEAKEGSGWVIGEITQFCGDLNSKFRYLQSNWTPIWFSLNNIKVLESKLIVTDISPAVKVFVNESD